MVGRGGFLTIAHKSGKFAGIEVIAEIKDTPIFENGGWIMKSDLVATAKVFRTDTDKSFDVSVSFNEYAQKTFKGDLTKFWKEKGVTMLKKVAESQSLRTAFNVNGIYIEEEINDQHNNEPKVKELPKEKDEVNAMLTEDLGNKAVNIVDGTTTDAEIEEMPAYTAVENEYQTHENQGTLELNLD